MRPTIDYLNARRECRAASGGTDYAARRNSQTARDRQAVDARASFAGLDYHEQCCAAADAIIADFRAWFRNLPAIGETETLSIEETF